MVGWGKTSYFLALCVNISKTVRYEIRPKLLLMTNRKFHALLIGSKIDDLELL